VKTPAQQSKIAGRGNGGGSPFASSGSLSSGGGQQGSDRLQDAGSSPLASQLASTAVPPAAGPAPNMQQAAQQVAQRFALPTMTPNGADTSGGTWQGFLPPGPGRAQAQQNALNEQMASPMRQLARQGQVVQAPAQGWQRPINQGFNSLFTAAADDPVELARLRQQKSQEMEQIQTQKKVAMLQQQAAGQTGYTPDGSAPPAANPFAAWKDPIQQQFLQERQASSTPGIGITDPARLAQARQVRQGAISQAKPWG
jgi:hypothetical protein